MIKKKNNQKYNIILDELESLNMHKENIYIKALIEFGKIIGNVGKKYIEFEQNMKDKFFLDSNKNLTQKKILKLKLDSKKKK